MSRAWLRPVFVMMGLTVMGLGLGCTNEQVARTGTVLGGELRVGDYAPDFSFAGPEGKIETFGAVRGVVTLLTFPARRDWPNCEQCARVAQLAGEEAALNTSVMVVSVGSPEGEGKSLSLYRCSIKSPAGLVVLEDRHGWVRRLYGEQAAGHFYVIGFDGRIAAIGSIEDQNTMKASLDSAVNEHELHWEKLNNHY